MTEPDIRLGGTYMYLIRFSVCQVNFFVGRKAKSAAKLDGDHG